MHVDSAVRITQLSVNYDYTPVLFDINLEIPKGRLVGLIGPNGAGKSTLIKACLGLVPSLSGKIEFFGSSLAKMKRRVAYVPQRESVDWNFPITAEELVLMGRYGKLGLFWRPNQQDREAAQFYLSQVGMSAFGKRQISQLSGGQQQRIFLARALLQEADLYFMDEPFTGVDIGTEKAMIALLRNLRDEGKTVIVVHHDLNSVKDYFDWTILLNTRLVASGHTQEVFTSENLVNTYGKSYSLFDEALRLSHKKSAGVE